MQRYQLNAGGQERPRVLANAHAFIDRLPVNKSWKIEIKEARRERSDPQNHALFGVAYPALEVATGYTKDELHDAFCRRFFGTVSREVMGATVSRAFRTTTTNDAGERDVIDASTFARFYDLVQQIGAEAGIDVPSPDPMHGQAARWAA